MRDFGAKVGIGLFVLIVCGFLAWAVFGTMIATLDISVVDR